MRTNVMRSNVTAIGSQSCTDVVARFRCHSAAKPAPMLLLALFVVIPQRSGGICCFPSAAQNLSSPQTIKTRANPADSRGLSVTLQPLYWIENEKAPAPGRSFSVFKRRNSFGETNLRVTLFE